MENNNFYRNRLDSINDGVYFVDLDRRITYWNKAAEVLSGYSEEQVIESKCSDNILVHTDDKGVLKEFKVEFVEVPQAEKEQYS